MLCPPPSNSPSSESACMEARRSQSSNGRRRRLLNQQGDVELLAEFEALTVQPKVSSTPESIIASADRHILTRMISSQLWKHAALVTLILVLAISAIAGEIYQPEVLRNLADSHQPRLSKGFAGGFLLIAGQLSLLIAWIRSGSTVDFSGRYRCWKWLSVCLTGIGVLWITNFQNSLPQLAQLFAQPLIGEVGAARNTLVVVPLAAVSLWVMSRIIPDMGRNRWSQVVFCLGVAAGVARLLLAYDPSPNPSSVAVLDSVLLASSGLIISALLLHARFVMYISKDPPERKTAKETSAAASAKAADAPQSKTKDEAPEVEASETELQVVAEQDSEVKAGTNSVPQQNRRKKKRPQRRAA